MIRAIGLFLALCVALVAFPAAAETPPATTTTAATTTPTPPLAVPDAGVLRDDLLTLALGNLDAQASASFTGFFPAWKTKYPTLGGDGFAVTSVPGRVSIWYNLLSSKDSESAANPKVIAFVVADAQGRCAGAVIYGFPKTDKSQKFDVVGTCNAQTLVNQFKTVFTVTPPPITTVPATVTAAPKPPTVGNSAATGDGQSPLLLGSLSLLAGIACAAVAGLVSRRRDRT